MTVCKLAAKRQYVVGACLSAVFDISSHIKNIITSFQSHKPTSRKIMIDRLLIIMVRLEQ